MNARPRMTRPFLWWLAVVLAGLLCWAVIGALVAEVVR